MRHCIVPKRDPPLALHSSSSVLCIWNKWKLAAERYAKWSSSNTAILGNRNFCQFLSPVENQIQSFTRFVWTALQTESRTEVLPCLIFTPGKDMRYYLSYKQSFLCQRLKSCLVSRLTSLVPPIFKCSCSNRKTVNFVRKLLRNQILYLWTLLWANG